MDRNWAIQRVRNDEAAAAGPVLPSRARALDRGRAALAAPEPGPLVLTGEPGIGKTWLARQIVAGRPTLVVDLPPSADATGLFAAIGHALGLAATGETRLALADYLAERSADGRRWVLVLDEAHGLSDAALDEVRVLSNRLGRPDGFDGLILVGQTRLARRLATQDALAGLAARVTARLQLGPIDADEAATLLADRLSGRSWTSAEVDRLHRDASGNPRQVLRLALDASPVTRGVSTVAAAPVAPPARPVAPAPAPAPSPARPASPLLGPTRPPIQEEEGVIEVGWEPDRPAPPTRSVVIDLASASASGTGSELESLDDLLPDLDVAPSLAPGGLDQLPAEEPVHDHYAALQAWNEWARNQGRAPAATAPADPVEPAQSDEGSADDETTADPAETAPAAAPANGSHPQVWAEGPDQFAPYSHLFSRLRPSRGQD